MHWDNRPFNVKLHWLRGIISLRSLSCFCQCCGSCIRAVASQLKDRGSSLSGYYIKNWKETNPENKSGGSLLWQRGWNSKKAPALRGDRVYSLRCSDCTQVVLLHWCTGTASWCCPAVENRVDLHLQATITGRRSNSNEECVQGSLAVTFDSNTCIVFGGQLETDVSKAPQNRIKFNSSWIPVLSWCCSINVHQ